MYPPICRNAQRRQRRVPWIRHDIVLEDSSRRGSGGDSRMRAAREDVPVLASQTILDDRPFGLIASASKARVVACRCSIGWDEVEIRGAAVALLLP